MRKRGGEERCKEGDLKKRRGKGSGRMGRERKEGREEMEKEEKQVDKLAQVSGLNY